MKASLILLLVCAAVSGCTIGKQTELTAILESRMIYQCANGEPVVAEYYTLADKSLHFVKLTLPDGREYTLPNVLSASGVRYTDDAELLWWTKGDTAFAQNRGPDGQWRSLYLDCRMVE